MEESLFFYYDIYMTQTVMKESNLQKLIKKLQRHKGKLISANKIKDHIHTILKDAYSDSKAYKLIYHCKNKGYILSLKKDIFLVKDPETIINEQEIIDNFYRNMVKKHAKEFIQ